MSLHRWSGILPLLTLALAWTAPAGAAVLDDPLNGSTIGTRQNGTFLPGGGWRIRAVATGDGVNGPYDCIYWHVPVMTNGAAFEYDVTGIGPDNMDDNGATPYGGSNELSHMYDWTYIAPGTGESGGDTGFWSYRNNPFKQYIRKQGDPGPPIDKRYTLECIWCLSGACATNEDTGVLSWSPAATYHFRCEWMQVGNQAQLKIYRSGVLLLTQAYTGTFAPGGWSVRIGASTRHSNEDASLGAVYKNIKVYNLTLAPSAPTIVSPSNGETVNTATAYVQWSGDVHTMYQLQINASNAPNTSVIYDSQQVSSDRNFAWTGALPNNATYYVFARIGNSVGWSPWSANGRTFTVNTSFVPGGIDYVKVKGNTLANKNGPFLGLGFSHFRALQRCKYDRPRYQSDLAFMASKGFRYQRALSMVAWDGLEIAPVGFQGPTHFVNAWSDYDQQLKDAIDIAYDNYSIKTELTIFADAQWVMPPDSPSNATRTAHLARILNDIVGREHKVILLEVGNELWQNGVSNVGDVQTKGQYLADRTPIPVALSAPFPDVSTMYAGSAADIATIHFSRDTGTVEGGWLPVRDCYDYANLPFVPPASSNEPIGPGSSVSAENDPIKLCMAAVFAWTAGLPSYVYHSKAGIQGWSGCCPPSGTEQFFQNMAGVDAYMNILPILPPDLASWVRNDGREAGSPFTSYCMGQANKWWPEVPGANNGCDRNIATIKGAEFVACPMGILVNGLTLQARRSMQINVYNPLTGVLVDNRTLSANDQFTLAQGPGAYVIKGIFTDLIGQGPEISVDLGCTDVANGLSLVPFGDGTTACVNVGGRECRQNSGGGSNYFYFAVSDGWDFQGGRPDVYISVEYYDAGTSTLTLQYDAGDGNFYKNGGSVTLTNTNMWKCKLFHVTDAYFGNRENAGADFRIADPGNTFYLDIVRVTTVTPIAPIVASPNPPCPRTAYSGAAYTQQWTVTQASPAPSWSFTQAPAGPQINANGLVTWTPTPANFGDNSFCVQAANCSGSDAKCCVVRVLSHMDFDFDGDVDSTDFGHMQNCLSGDGYAYGPGCNDADLDGDGDVDVADSNAFWPCLGGADHVPGC